jgi:hypothetical protein
MNDLKEKMLANFRNYGGEDGSQIIFPEILEGVVKHDAEGMTGNFHSKDYKNIVLWSTITQESIDAINSLVRDGILEMHWVTSPFLYLTGGEMLNLPIAQKAINYKTPRWAPTVFVMGPNYKKARKQA